MIENKKYNEFLKSQDTVRIYRDEKLIFASRKERLLPLMEYAMNRATYIDGVTVFDRVVGNAAALLLEKIKCREVFSPLGSENAIRTLLSSGIKYHFGKIVPYIKNESQRGMCPMEKLSAGKTSEEIYRILKDRFTGIKV